MKWRWVVCFAVFLLVVFTALVSSAQVSPGASFYQKALQEMKAGNYNEALVQIQLALAQSPEQLEFQYELGVIYFNLGRLDESEGIFQALVRQDEALFGKVRFDLAHIAKKRGKRLEAIEFPEKARPVDPGKADLEAGIAYLELKDYQRAIDSFRKAQSERPDLMFQTKMYESAALAKQKRYDESIKLLESLLKTKLTSEQNDLVSFLLTVLKADERNEKRWHLSGAAGFLYDTHLTMNPVAPAGLQRPSSEADFAQLSSITGRNDLVRNDPWVFGAGYNLYNLTYFEHSNESVLGASPLLYGYWNNPPFFAGLEYVYGHYWAGDSSKADVHSIYPVFAFNATQRWRSEILGWAEWREFYDTTPNDQLYGVGVMEYYLIRKGLAHFRAGVLWGRTILHPGRRAVTPILSSQPASSGRSGRINGLSMFPGSIFFETTVSIRRIIAMLPEGTTKRTCMQPCVAPFLITCRLCSCFSVSGMTQISVWSSLAVLLNLLVTKGQYSHVWSHSSIKREVPAKIHFRPGGCRIIARGASTAGCARACRQS